MEPGKEARAEKVAEVGPVASETVTPSPVLCPCPGRLGVDIELGYIL